jgi:DNA-binding transcriptional ArsR family regulator
MRTKSGTAIALDRIERCYLMPSAFNTRRWWAKYDTTDEHVTLYFPVWSGAESANALADDDRAREGARRHPSKARVESVDAEAVFRALGDTTRYAIASILARNPTSSADLSRSLKVSKPTITHHVQALRSAGLITEQAEGGSSRLSLNRETLVALSAAAERELFSSTGELQLLTTRKRRR